MIRSLSFPIVAWRELSARKALGWLAAALAIALISVLRHLIHDPYTLTVSWSVLLVASFVGWGSLVNLWVSKDRWHDWGLRAGWGMALFLLVGGYLCLLHLAVRPVLVFQVSVGVAALFATTALRKAPRFSQRRLTVLAGNAGVVAIVAGAWVLAALTFYGTMGAQGFQPSDDPPLYYVFAEKLVQASSLFEPFAGRRITTFGGQVYLHAAFLSVAPICYINVLDGGIGLVVVVALVLGARDTPRLKARHAVPLGLALLLLFSLQNVRVNSGSLFTGVAATLTLYRTVRAPLRCALEPDRPTWPLETRRVALLGVLTVACFVLRTSNVAAVMPFVALIFASDFLLGTRRPWARENLLSLARVGLIFVAAVGLTLLPWSIMMRQSTGTFFYPLGHSNVTPGWTLLEPSKKWWSTFTNFVDFLFYDAPISLLIPFGIAGLVPRKGRARNDLVALTIAALVGIFSLARTGGALGPTNSSRYLFAYCVAMALVACLSVRSSGGMAALVAAGLGMHLVTARDGLHKGFAQLITDAEKARTNRATTAVNFEANTGEYRDLQLHVPAGATIATAVNEGWQFDFTRNEILSLDVLGGMGPDPGWPAYKGAEALGKYLTANGVRYLIWVDFNLPSEFYNRGHWQGHLSKEGTYLQAEAKLQLDAEDAIEKLTTTRKVIYKANGMTVVDLAEAATAGRVNE